MASEEIDIRHHRFPFCIVWTPLPEDEMGFDWPTMYWKLPIDSVEGGVEAYDRAIQEASDLYKGRMVRRMWNIVFLHTLPSCAISPNLEIDLHSPCPPSLLPLWGRKIDTRIVGE
ncbi:unnamed protein product [Angiostrongylus costaricensis]|uniref:DUF3291 domain-containing protein n=1 Tax=Angiostrongylus costaricensis TaxID=334426 RepID=A0A0R3PUE4_ANGCS|nr:unnamed protein product [Angiostrongylus costaricensis]